MSEALGHAAAHLLRGKRIAGCGTCRYYRPALPVVEGDMPHGDCRRHAPVADPNRRYAGTFPQVALTSWCGDHERERPEDFEPFDDQGAR